MAETTATVTSSCRAKNVCQVPLEPVRPNVCPCNRINQLPCNANFPRRLAHGPLKDIAYAKPASDLLHIDGFAFKRKARVAGDDEQPLETREGGDDFFYHAVREVFLFGVAAHV